MNDAQFAEQVRREALASGHSPEVAAALVRYAGSPHQRRTAPNCPKGHAPRACTPSEPTLAETVERVCGLPKAVTSDFVAAGITTAEAATPLLRAHLDTEVRYGRRAATQYLRMDLAARAIYQRG